MTGQIAVEVVPDDDGVLLVVVAEVGTRPRRFLLDTGAATTQVMADDEIAALTGTAAPASTGVFAGAGTGEDMVTLPRFALGPVTRHDLPVRRLRESGPRPFADLVGMDVLGRHALLLRTATPRLLLDPPASERPAGTLPLTLDPAGHAYLPVTLGDGTARGVWDTGASMTVADAGLVARHPDHFTPAGESQGMDASGQVLVTPTYLLAGASIGGVAFAPHPVAAVDFGPINARISVPMDLVIGNTTTMQADWWLDVPGRRWAVLPRR